MQAGTISVAASVPGGVYSDLQKAGIIDDILKGDNDVLTRWIAYDSWIYTARFNISEDNIKTNVVRLVLEGVDTVAFIEMNRSPIGSTNNMFVKYVFDVKRHIKAGENELKFVFESPVEYSKTRSNNNFIAPDCVPSIYNGECHANQIRKMQASFGWDWGPAFPSVGIWRPIYLECFKAAIITSLTAQTKKDAHSWTLDIRVYLESGDSVRHIEGYLSAYLTVEGHQKIKVEKHINQTTRNDGITEIDINMTVSANVIREWWPNGFGDQPLYDLLTVFSTHDGDGYREVSYKNVKIGFRTLEVVEEDASLILGNTTAGQGLTFFFRINGYPIFMKGSNLIPMNVLPEIVDKRQIDMLLSAAVEAHMSMLRVWGGGLYESDYFYQRCDELGILVWQDFLFACSMYPIDREFINTVTTEIEQNVLRLQHHPSIAVWAGNNENEAALIGNWYHTSSQIEKYKAEYVHLYVDIIKPIVNAIDPGRRYLVSSPSNGIKSEEEGFMSKNPYDPHYGDTHYYNYLADNWNFNIYPKTRFASEYGFQSLPSLKTMRTATNKSSDFSVNSNYFYHRQHSPGGYSFIKNQINSRLKLNENDPEYFEKFIYYSQISQAMSMKVETEFYRQSQSDWYTMGALYWQLNDIWQAPSWSGIEYGGKWKMLHYFAKTFFAPVLVSPRLKMSNDIDIYLINDRFVPIIDGNITVDIFNWSNLEPVKTLSYSASVNPLSSRKQATLSLWDFKKRDDILLRFSLNAEGVSSPYNYLFPVPLKDATGIGIPKINISVKGRKKNSKKFGNEFIVTINVDTIILFLWLETDNIDGHFEHNGFILTERSLDVHYNAKEEITCKDLERDIKYQYYHN
ncbi:Beta-mannosidase [Danaus plexippus plexippus]|uniref:beta-mannosidase n=1 Tax=Danaus plexippus plexippus TaxID=278856 RepID=A0A212FKX6_DANPL|nr:Beta-mannosidase [Danaus plexippus plexippus]